MPRFVSYHFARALGFSALKNSPPMPSTFCLGAGAASGASAATANPSPAHRTTARTFSDRRSVIWSPIALALDPRARSVSSKSLFMPPSAQVPCRLGPFRGFEPKTAIQEQTRHDTPALEDQLRFGSHQPRFGLEHPLRGRQPDPRTPGRTELLHEFSLGQRVRRRKIDGAVDFGTVD